ncbi:MAG TPA: proline dehydrogenase family protein, partial [Acidimicrobiales bacterium]|nr:proline dehydrogenase family protein [Acidimicrobiales bacterium]
MTSVLRRGVLAAADAAIVRRQVERHGQRLVSRFVAGDSVADGLAAADALHGEGLGAILDLLGEGTATAGEAERAAAEIEELVGTLAARATREGEARVEVAVKLSHLGAQRDPALAGELLRRLLKVADGRVFLWIDMEGSDLTEPTVATYEALRPDHPALGLVLQAYLRRSAEDLVRVAPLDPWVRIVKGAYLEPPTVAFTRKADVDRNFAALVGTCFDRETRVAIASHDAPLVGRLLSEADARGLDRSRV